MKYQDNHLGSPLPIVGICEVDKSDPRKRVIHLKGNFDWNMPVKTYRLYKRFFDFNLKRVLAMLTEIYERCDNKSVFMVSILSIIIYLGGTIESPERVNDDRSRVCNNHVIDFFFHKYSDIYSPSLRNYYYSVNN